jgi:predicted nuclease with TOPRIM domain
MALHQEMYDELDDEVARCHSLIEELRDRIEHLEMEKAVIEYEGRVI